ncbi:MAG TPA: hypothetical protein VFW65_38160 [Pseudonocardiaceae bacterium]|nr:hypothetical protein [Pseudonocardiaceae bacterium]
MHGTAEAWVTSPTAPPAEHADPGSPRTGENEAQATGDDVADQLHALIVQGFRFAYPRRANGEIAAVVGVRAHHNVVDIVQLFGEHDADAARIPGDEPDILSPRHVIWRATGPANNVLQQVLDHQDIDCTDITPGSAHNGCWLSAGPSHAVWLPSTPP